MVWMFVFLLLNFIVFVNVRRTSALIFFVMTYLSLFFMSFLIVFKFMGLVMIFLYVGKFNVFGFMGVENGNFYLWVINCCIADKYCLCTIFNKYRYRSVLNLCCWFGLYVNFCWIVEIFWEIDDIFCFVLILFMLVLVVWVMRFNSFRRSIKFVARLSRLFIKFLSFIRCFCSVMCFEWFFVFVCLFCDVVLLLILILLILCEGGCIGFLTSTTSVVNGFVASVACARVVIFILFVLFFFVILCFDVEGLMLIIFNLKFGKKLFLVGFNVIVARVDYRRVFFSFVSYSAFFRDMCLIGLFMFKNFNLYGSFFVNFVICVFVRIVFFCFVCVFVI